MPKIARGGQYNPLFANDVEAIHDTGLKVLEEVGVEVRSRSALEAFERAGMRSDGRVVRIPRRAVEDAISAAPSSVTLYGRHPDYDLSLEGNNVYLGTGGTAINVLDLDGRRRPSTLQDVRDLGRLVDALANIHFYMLPVYPHDLPTDQVDANRFFAGLSNTKKHVTGGVYTLQGVRDTIRMAAAVAGGHEALRERPILSFVILAISPLRIDDLYGDMLVEIAKSGLPVIVPTEPQCGSTAPMTLAGNLVLFSAETLAQVTLVQLVNPGTPVICGYVGTVADPRTMGYLAGAVEMGLLNAGAAALAHYWKLPIYATAGMSDSKVPDAQSGYESALTTLMVAMSGANYIHDSAGLLDFALTMSYEKTVIDDEINGMVLRALEGISVTPDHMAYEAIKEVGPGGNFLVSPHTLRHLRSEVYLPRFSDRSSYDEWTTLGSKDARMRANEVAREILNTHEPSAMDERMVREAVKAVGYLRSKGTVSIGTPSERSGGG